MSQSVYRELRTSAELLGGSMHGCPCGYHGDPSHECVCSASAIGRYQRRISVPLLDRIDIHIEVPRVEYEKLADDRLGEPSEQIQKRVEAARARQRERFAGASILSNSEMTPKEVGEHCRPDPVARDLLRAAMNQMRLSARGFRRVLKLARTIDGLAGAESITAARVAGAIQHRPLRLGYTGCPRCLANMIQC